MSEAGVMLVPMMTEDALHTALAGEGVTVCEAALPGVVWGAYNRSAGVVYVQQGLPQSYRIAVLAHELCHVRRQDQGHQCQAVEDEIDETVALMLVNPAEYAFWEDQLGWSTGGIAAALDLPRWVIEAYRRVLARNRLATEMATKPQLAVSAE